MERRPRPHRLRHKSWLERALHCGARCDPQWETRTWPFSSAGTLAAVAIVAETVDARLGDHLHRVRSLETPRNALVLPSGVVWRGRINRACWKIVGGRVAFPTLAGAW